MLKRNSYHTSIKLAFATGHLYSLPNDFIDKIPSSTKSDWRKSTIDKFIGTEFAESVNKDLTKTKSFHHPSMRVERTIFMTVAKIKFFLLSILGKKEYQKLLRDNMSKTVNLIEKFQGSINVKNACRLLGISIHTFYNWKSIVKFKCDSSPLLLCVKRHVSQATIQEVNKIKEYLSDPQYLHWAISSIWGFAFKNGETRLSRSTWYKYNRILKIRKRRRRLKKNDYKPLRASKINEIWHIDITRVRTRDTMVHYIYSIKDNYSKMVLAWYQHHRVDGKITSLLIKKACLRAFGDKPTDELTKLISDGGPENKSYAVKDFIKDAQTNIEHLIALKDIIQSNSMIESHFRGLKGYLRHKDIENGNQLFRASHYYHHESNFVRPHYEHNSYTPAEVYEGKDNSIDQSIILAHAALERRHYNRNSGCGKCE